MNNFTYYNLRERKYSHTIDLLFPGWEKGNECLAVFGAHDDDALIGAGYAITAAKESDAEVYVVIFCNGDCGYSVPEQKDSIVSTRRVENEKAYAHLDIKKEKIIRFEYPDFSLGQYIGNKLQCGGRGTFSGIVDFIRNKGITRVMIPNGYREHTDHTAAYNITIADIIQAGDAVVADWGPIQHVKSYLQYSVWAEFSPEDSLLCGEQDLSIRANRAIVCQEAVERLTCSAISEYVSQGAIIHNLIESRRERLIAAGYMELYIDLDPRPKLSFYPYGKRIESIMKNHLGD